MRVKLTEDFVANDLICPPNRRKIEFVDISDAIGLYLEVTANRPNRAVYRYRFRDRGGTTRHATIGPATDVSLEEARKQAKAMRAKVTLGLDPRGDSPVKPSASTSPQAPTLASFFDESYWPYIEARNRDAKKSRQRFDLRIRPRWGDVPLDCVTPEQIQVFHTSLRTDEGLAPATANRYLALIKTMYRRAVQWEITTQSPAARIALFREENTSERYLTEDELARLVKLLKTDPARNVCNVALFLLATGARLNEALTATWANIDRQNRVWRISASNSKSKRVRSVPLNDTALAVLDELGTEGKHENLFVTARGERLKHVHGVWGRLKLKAGLKDANLHLLRHQAASTMISSGRSLAEVQAILGHSNPSMTNRYAHLSTRALQEASDTVATAIENAWRRSA